MRRPQLAWSHLLYPSIVAIIALLTGCAAGMSRLKTGLDGKPGVISMPDVFRMSKAKAISTLKLAGHSGDVAWDDQLCGSVVDGQIVEKGEVCRQTPAAGQELPASGPVSLLVQSEEPRHGKVGQFGEWHLMPDVIGLSLDEAVVAMRAAGFTDERNHIDERDDPGCKPRVVCRTYPEAFERAGQDSDRYITVGVDAAAHAADPPPPPPTLEDDASAPRDGSTQAPPPPPPPQTPHSNI
jgi:beta-lactam-binding protein with PASTA domain